MSQLKTSNPTFNPDGAKARRRLTSRYAFEEQPS